MSCNVVHLHGDRQPRRRLRPRHGRQPPLDVIRGPWRPSGTIDGAGVFAVVWSALGGELWAALHDFEPAARHRLLEQCRDLDQYASGSAAVGSGSV